MAALEILRSGPEKKLHRVWWPSLCNRSPQNQAICTKMLAEHCLPINATFLSLG